MTFRRHATFTGRGSAGDRARTPAPGRPFADRIGAYEPLLQLASGGMAAVWVARHGTGQFERLVALKRVHPHLLDEREFRDLFRDEARIAANVHHPNVVPLLEVLELEDELVLVLEYVDGTSLSSLLQAAADAGIALPPAIASRIVIDALAGLHSAHEARDVRGIPLEIVHRDVSPQNILVGADGSSRLIDFGIAKAAVRLASTDAGVLRGKLAYMAPEQIGQHRIDRRADVFSAGVVLHRALTGRELFHAEDEGDVLLSVLVDEVPPASEVRPGLPRAIDQVLATALERDRDARFRTAAEFEEALEQVLPPARPREVARFVEHLRGRALARRREALRAMLAHRTPRERATSYCDEAPTKQIMPPRHGIMPPRHGAGLAPAISRGAPAAVRPFVHASTPLDDSDDSITTIAPFRRPTPPGAPRATHRAWRRLG